YKINTRIVIEDVKSDINIIGDKGSKILIPESGFLYLKSYGERFKLESQIKRGTHSFTVNGSERLKPGNILRISSDSNWETGWNYKENDTHIIKKIDNNKIYTNDAFVFNYDPFKEEVEITISQNSRVSISDLTLIFDSQKHWKKVTAIEIVSIRAK